MAKRTIAGGLALWLALLLAAPASVAQNARPGPRPNALEAPPTARGGPLPNYYLERRSPVAPKGPVNPGDVAASLRARGFSDIGPLQRRGNTVIVPQATGPSGEKVQLVIGPNGDIVGVRVLGRGRR